MKNENIFEKQRQKLLKQLDNFYNNPELSISTSSTFSNENKKRLHAHGFHEIFIFKNAHIKINPLGELHCNISANERSQLSATFSLNQNQFDWVIIPYGFCCYVDRELPSQLDHVLTFLQLIPQFLHNATSQTFNQDIAKLLIKILVQLIGSTWATSYDKTNIAQKACALINKNYNDHNLSAQSIAMACGYSLQGLNVAFHKEFKCSVRQYLINLRLRDAAYKLINSIDYDVSSIAYASGWNNRAYFSNSFRKAYGLPPHAYRESVLAGKLPKPAPPLSDMI